MSSIENSPPKRISRGQENFSQLLREHGTLLDIFGFPPGEWNSILGILCKISDPAEAEEVRKSRRKCLYTDYLDQYTESILPQKGETKEEFTLREQRQRQELSRILFATSPEQIRESLPFLYDMVRTPVIPHRTRRFRKAS